MWQVEGAGAQHLLKPLFWGKNRLQLWTPLSHLGAQHLLKPLFWGKNRLQLRTPLSQLPSADAHTEPFTENCCGLSRTNNLLL